MKAAFSVACGTASGCSSRACSADDQAQTKQQATLERAVAFLSSTLGDLSPVSTASSMTSKHPATQASVRLRTWAGLASTRKAVSQWARTCLGTRWQEFRWHDWRESCLVCIQCQNLDVPRPGIETLCFKSFNAKGSHAGSRPGNCRREIVSLQRSILRFQFKEERNCRVQRLNQ